ncbi:hypothetical protein AcW1_002100 [Taiwanofungus camphoratus]|nr:hypothetical protein AcW1_002100 [Antrodia cinnamomea]KAI0946014.1 hypothetical protein AcV7_010104 [Antrodia cinnamomea]
MQNGVGEGRSFSAALLHKQVPFPPPSRCECLSRSHPGMARHLNAAQYKNVFYQSTRHIAQHRTALAAPRSTLAFSVDICFIRIPFVLDCKRIFPTHNQPGAGERDRASRTH